ncbi:hypothetical protein GCM10027413_27050 [Conyzicola nivalis]|uniref:Uncharacterized protein n=1 Tax=Conyzicola nivalis TaxID=1477021 RepID=A0A916SSE1_9MICO|nr:DUF6264 family protein [Conyzicola nivalis]GGB15357.1 hypothetical protein GCM10010979_32460 [Conyzicola nivalis]
MSDQRERPQYGEYASVDEQVAAGGFRVEHEQPAAAPLAPPLATTRVPGAPPTPRPWDLALTVTFLVFGAYSVASSVPSLLDFGATLDQMYALSGYGDYTELELAHSIGIAILVSQSVLFVVTVIVTLIRLRARKLAFFVPLIGGALAGIVIFVLLLVAMVSDPALAATIGTPS